MHIVLQLINHNYHSNLLCNCSPDLTLKTYLECHIWNQVRISTANDFKDIRRTNKLRFVEYSWNILRIFLKNNPCYKEYIMNILSLWTYLARLELSRHTSGYVSNIRIFQCGYF